jgi:exonuclease V
VKPSTLIADTEGSSRELRDAAEILDGKLEKLWDFVAE